MIDASMLLIALVAGLSAWLAHSNANGRRQVQRQMEIVSRGLEPSPLDLPADSSLPVTEVVVR